jgi:hypothetical protein
MTIIEHWKNLLWWVGCGYAFGPTLKWRFF